MSWLCRSIEDLSDTAELSQRRHGVIEIADGRLRAIHLRRWPKVGSALEIELLGHRWHTSRPGDRGWLYYNQPRSCPNYLALVYVVSNRDCTLATIRRGLQTLDEIARIKQTDAILCDVWNDRISARLLARWGWEPQKITRWHRQYIKRFYGVYPSARRASDDSELEPAMAAV